MKSSEFQRPSWTSEPPARAKLTPDSTITHSHSPQKRALERFCFYKSPRANRVYRRSHWSQGSFKHRADPEALRGFSQESFTLLSFGRIWVIYSFFIFVEKNRNSFHLKYFFFGILALAFKLFYWRATYTTFDLTCSLVSLICSSWLIVFCSPFFSGCWGRKYRCALAELIGQILGWGRS